MKKIAFVVQRYGLEINGGAELHCRQLAEKLASIYDVDVLTTCALDYMDWADHYPEGESTINNVRVKRFKVARIRDWEEMFRLEKKIRPKQYRSALKNAYKKFRRSLLGIKAIKADYINWVVAQGPETPRLINYIRENEQDYDCLIFFTYLYYPTVFGIGINPGKSILIPTAHDEWAIRMPVYKKMFSVPICIMYNTLAEKRIVNKIFNNQSVYSEIAGVGVDVPDHLPGVDTGIDANVGTEYVLYIGRIDVNKITPGDFKWFLKYVAETKKDIKLVLIGNLYMEIPKSDRIIYLGFVDDDTKFNLIRHCLFLFQPSLYESLSMVVLEAFMMEKPVLVHKNCEVMRDHVDNSNAGFYYNDYPGFKNAFNLLINDRTLNAEMGKEGKKYVDKNYRWETIISKFQYVIENKIGKSKK